MPTEALSTEKIWESLNSRLRRFFLARVPDEQVASDLLQDTFLRIHEKLDSLDDHRRMAGWVFRIARNKVVDYYRSRPLGRLDGVPEIGGGPEPDRNVNQEVSDWLPVFIDKLPSGYREAVRLYELDGVPQKEIAERLGLSLSGAKSRIQRGRQKLKRLLHDCCVFDLDRHGNVLDYRSREEERCCRICRAPSGD